MKTNILKILLTLITLVCLDSCDSDKNNPVYRSAYNRGYSMAGQGITLAKQLNESAEYLKTEKHALEMLEIELESRSYIVDLYEQDQDACEQGYVDGFLDRANNRKNTMSEVSDTDSNDSKEHSVIWDIFVIMCSLLMICVSYNLAKPYDADGVIKYHSCLFWILLCLGFNLCLNGINKVLCPDVTQSFITEIFRFSATFLMLFYGLKASLRSLNQKKRIFLNVLGLLIVLLLAISLIMVLFQ